jgi:hypothetical protein
MTPVEPINPRDRDEEAVALAEQWWPNRYVGDLTTAQWCRVYEALDATREPSDD